jgi:molybdopterin biosynthesis enzyme
MRLPANPLLNHHSVDAAIAWVDATTDHLDTEDAPLGKARGRVLTEDIRAVRPIPASDRAALDGFAIQANASLGASAYNPIRLPLIAVAAGDALPAETDAVVPLELAEPDERACIEIVEAVAAGHNVEQRGAIATIGVTLVAAGIRLAARHIGLLRIAGLSAVPVMRRPRVRILVAEPAKAGAGRHGKGEGAPAERRRDGGDRECRVGGG